MRRTPTTIRYTAPTSLIAVNAVADDAISAESPTIAAATWTMPPLATPSAETRPARRPLSTLCVTMYATAGPGTTASATAARLKRAIVEAVGTASLPERRAQDGRRSGGSRGGGRSGAPGD